MKRAVLEKKRPGVKAIHPTELIRQIQRGLPFSQLETLQNKIDLPLEQLRATRPAAAHAAAPMKQAV